MSEVRVRPVAPADAEAWVELRSALWPEHPDDHVGVVAAFLRDPPDGASCLLVEDGAGTVVGFAEVGLRRYAEGCLSSPVGYLEGIYVETGARREGYARALVTACEAWARARGCTELASDRALDEEESGAFHRAVGFEEAGRIVCYRKPL